MVGWKRIVITVGEKIGKTHLTYAQGACAEITAAATIAAADVYGLPVSTTHVLSSGIAGTMSANGSGLQLSTVRSIALAWVLTLPAAMVISGTLYWAFSAIFEATANTAAHRVPNRTQRNEAKTVARYPLRIEQPLHQPSRQDAGHAAAVVARRERRLHGHDLIANERVEAREHAMVEPGAAKLGGAGKPHRPRIGTGEGDAQIGKRVAVAA